MARPRFFYRFPLDLGLKVHNFEADPLSLLLVARSPLPDMRLRGELDELPDGNGYERGGQFLAGQSWTEDRGVAQLQGDPVTWTASGRVGPIRGAVLVNGEVLVCWWEAGLPMALEAGDTLTAPFEGRMILSIG